MSTPTELTLRQLRHDGWPIVAVVEHWQHHAKRRVDLLGIADILAIGHPDDPTLLLVQCTSSSNAAARARKITAAPALPHLREAGVRVQVWGWRRTRTGWVHRIIDLS